MELTLTADCRELFKSLDTDASNTIEAKELADGLKAQGYSVSQQELAQLMGRVDFDRNGTLDIEEFISGLIDWTEVNPSSCMVRNAVIMPLVYITVVMPNVRFALAMLTAECCYH